MIETTASKNANEIFKTLLKHRLPVEQLNCRTVWVQDRIRIVCYDTGLVLIQRAINGTRTRLQNDQRDMMYPDEDIVGAVVTWWEDVLSVPISS